MTTPKRPRKLDLRTATGVITANDLGSTLRPGESIRIGPPMTPPRGTTPTPPRSKPKARKTRTAWTEQERDAALEAMQREGSEGGIAGAHRATGIPKGTLSRWARAAGIDLGAHARRRTAAASAGVAAKAAEVRVTTVTRLERILEQQLELEQLIGDLELKAGRQLLDADLELEHTIAGPRYVVTGPAAVELARLRSLLEVTPKRDAVGARTRSVHDLNLLKGEATERGAIVVRFGIPRPSALEADRLAVDEADLGASTP